MKSTPNISSPTRSAGSRCRLILGLAAMALALALALVPVGSASANTFISKRGAQRMATDFVSKHYADTYRGDLTAVCRPQGRAYDPRYTYHRWVCGWYDRSDDTGGVVLIVGSGSGPGAYYGKVLRGASRAS